MLKTTIAIFLIVVFVVSIVSLQPYVPSVESKITTNIGGKFPYTDEGLMLAYWSLNNTENAVINLPRGEMAIDRHIIMRRDKLSVVGVDDFLGRTVLNFVNHTMYFDPYSSVNGYRACKPQGSLRMTELTPCGLKVMDMEGENIYLKSILFTGSAKLRIVFSDLDSNILLENVDFKNIDRVFTHHTDYGSWFGTVSFEVKLGTVHAGGILVKNCDIDRTTDAGFTVTFRGVDTTVSNITYQNCTTFRCGMPVNGVEIVDWYNINGQKIKENNNWQNWSIGFGLVENYWNPTQLTPTAIDWLFDNCTAEESRESGFHSEYRAIEENITFKNCKSNRNGQKWLSQGYSYGYNPNIETYSSGFLGFPDSRHTITMIDCQANDNFFYGYWGSNSVYSTQMSRCTALGNGLRNFY